MDILIIILIGVVFLVVAALVLIGLHAPEATDPLESRLAAFSESGRQVTLEEIELAAPFHERVIYPLARKLGELVLKFTPQNAIQTASQKLERAGNPGNLDPALFFAFRFIGLGLGVFLFVLAQFGDEASPLYGKGLIIAIPAAMFGYFIPDLILKSIMDRRQKEVVKALPDALDLLTICVEAGLGFDAAMAKVYEKWDNELSRAFGRVLREVQFGKTRREALRDMSERAGVAELTSFIAAVIQSEQLGVSLAQVLRIQSDQMRVKRRQAAEELAHKAPIKMLFPMALFIFPTICIVIMTPAVLNIIQSGVFSGGGP
jgi:tight adherence protein C